jgi:hypothetical protein
MPAKTPGEDFEESLHRLARLFAFISCLISTVVGGQLDLELICVPGTERPATRGLVVELTYSAIPAGTVTGTDADV